MDLFTSLLASSEPLPERSILTSADWASGSALEALDLDGRTNEQVTQV